MALSRPAEKTPLATRRPHSARLLPSQSLGLLKKRGGWGGLIAGQVFFLLASDEETTQAALWLRLQGEGEGGGGGGGRANMGGQSTIRYAPLFSPPHTLRFLYLDWLQVQSSVSIPQAGSSQPAPFLSLRVG